MLFKLTFALIFAITIFFFPLDFFTRKRRKYAPEGKIDERDTLFARMQRTEGTEAYEDYYSKNPELKHDDDLIREMTPLMMPGSHYYDEKTAKKAEKYFEDIQKINLDETLINSWAHKINEDKNISKLLKICAMESGAVKVGFTSIKDEFVYSFKGRLDEDYGMKISLDHKYAIVFLVEMDHDFMNDAPDIKVLEESARQYYNAAKISFLLKAVLEKCGYSAKAHYDAHYDMMMVPLAVDAGLGELGRNNILLADKYGSRVRIGAVSTNLVLPESKQAYLGVQHFCEICKKCAYNCPSKSLSVNNSELIRGIEKWPTKIESCYRYWRYAGSDCGICMAICPYSHKNNILHNVVRNAIKLNPWIRVLAVKLDDLIYGKKWKERKSGFFQSL